ncbi:hypothetical protein N431DRAFT_499384 [Stipitochalara longipes BDJ]|nr:hypothetical protein N431DRAFT_499384 [Stipitochalara longipes BDJ]
MIRDDRTYPSTNEAGFVAWLAKPDMQGGLVVALLQPAKTQIYTSDFQWVKDECATLAYLDESLAFLNSPGGLVTTSVFDAFPFITERVYSEELSTEATGAHKKFIAMLEAKKPEVVFACWRVLGLDLPFSGKGVGGATQVETLKLSNGHVVRVVNGFHPSYMANFYANESCFRRLFTMELCKAFCELNNSWEEDRWMNILRWKCRDRTRQLREGQGRGGEQLDRESGHVFQGSREDDSARKFQAYIKSFDNGLQRLKQVFDHMVLPTYKSQGSWDLYAFLVFNQNTSEGICDILLAVSEAMKQATPGTYMTDSSLSDHISEQTLKFLEDDIPDLMQYSRGLYSNLWSLQFETSASQGLKCSIEKITITFIENLTKLFYNSSKSSPHTLELLHNAFKEIAISFEDSLGKEYDSHQRSRTARTSNILEMRARQGQLETQLLQALIQVLSATIVTNPATILRTVRGPRKAA